MMSDAVKVPLSLSKPHLQLEFLRKASNCLHRILWCRQSADAYRALKKKFPNGFATNRNRSWNMLFEFFHKGYINHQAIPEKPNTSCVAVTKNTLMHGVSHFHLSLKNGLALTSLAFVSIRMTMCGLNSVNSVKWRDNVAMCMKLLPSRSNKEPSYQKHGADGEAMP